VRAGPFTVMGLNVRSIEKEKDDGNQDLIDICDRGRNMAAVTNVLIGATAVATAIFYWRGDLAEGSQPREALAKRRRPACSSSPRSSTATAPASAP
jgi:hypothetical protein